MTLALRFVIMMGIVNLFADMTYEGGRGEVGAFLGNLGATGAVVGLVAGGGELAGYVVRSFFGALADRTGRYWTQAWIGYVVNLLSVPALALVGSWPAASALVVGERVGRGIRRPVISGIIAEAGRELGGGRAFGVNVALDQVGATIGPLIVAFAVMRGGFHIGFGVLIIPAVLALACLIPAMILSRGLTPKRAPVSGPLFRDAKRFRWYAIGGALVAAGYVDFALIAYRFGRDHIASPAAISVWFAVAMAVGGLSAPLLGKLLDRYGAAIVALAVPFTAAAVPLAFLGHGYVAGAGAALWGVGTAVQDSLLLALVATVLADSRKATALGLYDTIFGIAWFVGSAAFGFLLDKAILTLVVLSVVLQLLAIPFFLIRSKRGLAETTS